MTQPPEPEWASLDVVRDELDIEREIQTKRIDSAETRAGVIVGFAGALAALALSTQTLLALPGALVAVGAAMAAMRVLRPSAQNTVDPVNLRRLYVARQMIDTKKAALDRRVTDYEKNQETVGDKIKYLKRAMTTLTMAIALVVAGVGLRLILNAFQN